MSSETTAGDFVAYGPSHVAALGILAALAALMVMVGRRLRGDARERSFRRGFSVALLGVEVGFQLYSMLPQHWGIEHSLPLELCDLAWMAAFVALWSGSRRAGALLYYWGFTLTLQALLTPRLAEEFPSMTFAMFFASHGLTVLAAVYLTFGTGNVRPTWRLLAFAAVVTLGWGALILAFNTLAGTNYLFVNHKPPTRSLLDLLGPWPWYLVWEVAIGLLAWAALTLPWYWGGAGSRTRKV